MPDFSYIIHKDLRPSDLKAICRLKSLAFPYNLASQEEWIKKNLTPDDIHVLYKPGRTIFSYLNLIRISLDLDGKAVDGYGIGNVCSREKGKGYGTMIMDEVNRFLDEESKPGMLFCKESLVPFYLNNGWRKADRESVMLSSPDHMFETMVFNCPEFKKIKYLGRLF